MISAFMTRSLGYDGLSYDQEIRTARNLGIINSYDELKSSWVTRELVFKLMYKTLWTKCYGEDDELIYKIGLVEDDELKQSNKLNQDNTLNSDSDSKNAEPKIIKIL